MKGRRDEEKKEKEGTDKGKKGHYLAKSTRDAARRERKGLWSALIESYWLWPLSSWNMDVGLYLKWTADERLQEQDLRVDKKTPTASQVCRSRSFRGNLRNEAGASSCRLWLHKATRRCRAKVLIVRCHGRRRTFSSCCPVMTRPRRVSRTWS